MKLLSTVSTQIRIVLMLLFSASSTIGCGGGGDETIVILPEDTTVQVSGVLTSDGVPVGDALVNAFLRNATDSPLTISDTDANGAYTVQLLRGDPTYLSFSKVFFVTVNSPYLTFDANTTGVNFETIETDEAEVVIDVIFGGMMLDLADKAWLAVEVNDMNGNDADGATITPTPAPAGGGAIMCDGTLTGGNITVAPPCVPEREAPMYLAYYDADAEVTVTVTGGATMEAPLRLGQVTVIEVNQ